MRIGILSDTHDNIWKLAEALERLKKVDVVIHCGDLCAPFIVKRMGEGLPDIPIHVVWGNNDGDPQTISRVALAYNHVHLHGQFAKLEFNGLRVGVNHYPEIATEFADSRNFDLVCYGHDHTAHQELRGDCLLLNPGELMGMNGTSSFAIYDLQKHQAEIIEV